MNKNLIRNWIRSLRSLSDERGAESSEVILVLVVLVIGLLGAWAFLKGKIINKATQTGNCINNAATSTKC